MLTRLRKTIAAVVAGCAVLLAHPVWAQLAPAPAAGVAAAQGPEPAGPLSPLPYGPSADEVYRHGHRQRTAGMILTFAGIGLTAIGGGFLIAVIATKTDEMGPAAVAAGLIGVGTTITGILLWRAGDDNMAASSRMRTADLSLVPGPSSSLAGLSLRLRF